MIPTVITVGEHRHDEEFPEIRKGNVRNTNDGKLFRDRRWRDNASLQEKHISKNRNFDRKDKK